MTLRSLSPRESTSPYLAWLRDPVVTRFLEVRFRAYDAQSLERFIAACNDSNDTLLLGIVTNDDGRHIGNLKLAQVSHRHKRAEVGLLIGERSAWGHGFATDSLRTICRYAFGPLGLHKITAGCYEHNVASIRAFLNAGFEQVAVLADHWLLDGAWTGQVLLQRLAPPSSTD